jgi:hypothetical protein
MPSLDKLEEMLTVIDNAENVQIAEGYCIVLLFGDSGAGKSTCVNFLTNQPMKVVPIPNSTLLRIDLVADEERETNIFKKSFVLLNGKATSPDKSKIGHTSISEALEAKTVIDEVNKIIYIDCPGLNDNRGPMVEIANAFRIMIIFNSESAVKILLVLDENSLIQTRGNSFRQFLQSMYDWFSEDLDRVISSINFVVTQKDNLIDLDIQFQHIYEEYKNNPFECNGNHVIVLQKILESKRKFLAFSRPKAVSMFLFNNIEERDAILDALKTTEAVKFDVAMGVSMKAKVYLETLAHSVIDKFVNSIATMSLEDVETLSEDCRPFFSSKDPPLLFLRNIDVVCRKAGLTYSTEISQLVSLIDKFDKLEELQHSAVGLSSGKTRDLFFLPAVSEIQSRLKMLREKKTGFELEDEKNECAKQVAKLEKSIEDTKSRATKQLDQQKSLLVEMEMRNKDLQQNLITIIITIIILIIIMNAV